MTAADMLTGHDLGRLRSRAVQDGQVSPERWGSQFHV